MPPRLSSLRRKAGYIVGRIADDALPMGFVVALSHLNNIQPGLGSFLSNSVLCILVIRPPPLHRAPSTRAGLGRPLAVALAVVRDIIEWCVVLDKAYVVVGFAGHLPLPRTGVAGPRRLEQVTELANVAFFDSKSSGLGVANEELAARDAPVEKVGHDIGREDGPSEASKEALDAASEGEDLAVGEGLLEVRVRNWIDNGHDERDVGPSRVDRPAVALGNDGKGLGVKDSV